MPSAVFAAITQFPFGSALALFCFFMVWSVGGLSCYHYYLMCKGMTTNEELKKGKQKSEYPGGCKYCIFVLWGPWYPSYLNLRDIHFDPDHPLGSPVSLDV